MAEKVANGRVLVIGDAAHMASPRTAAGAHTGIIVLQCTNHITPMTMPLQRQEYWTLLACSKRLVSAKLPT